MSLGGKLTDETDTFILRPPCLPSPTFGSVRGQAPALPRAGSDWPGLQAASPAHPQPLARLPAPSCCGSLGIHPQSWQTQCWDAQVDLARIVTLNHLEKTDYINPSSIQSPAFPMVTSMVTDSQLWRNLKHNSESSSMNVEEVLVRERTETLKLGDLGPCWDDSDWS